MGGSSGGDTQKTTTTQNSVSEPWKEQVPYLKYGLNEASRLYQQQGPMYYPGSTVAPFSAEQNQAFNLGGQRALQGNQTMDQAESFTQDVMGGKYLNNPYQDEVFNNIKSQVMPAVNSQFMGSGRYGGNNLHTDTMTRALTESYAPYASQNWQQGLDRMGQAANMAPMFAANDWTDLGALEAIGQQKQQLGQSELNDATTRWDYYQNLPYSKLNQYIANTGGNYGGTTFGTSTQKIPTNQPSMFQQVAGAGMGLLGTAGSLGLFSDRRMKEDIRRVGQMDDGTPIYTYRYKGSPLTQMGVMAQEVAETNPDAVMMRPEGFLAVDYAKLARA